MTPQRKILFVDDESLLLANLVIAAKKNAYDADSAPDGLTALELMKSNHYDLIVTDVRLPGLDGVSLIEKGRAINRSTSFIAISGYGSLDLAIDLLRSGVEDFLLKPFDEKQLIESIDNVFSHGAPPKPIEPDWNVLSCHFGLSNKELDVIRAFYSTRSCNNELADHLCLSVDTVKSHLKSAFKKFLVKSRVELFAALNRWPNL